MNVTGKQPECRWVGVAGRSPVHCKTLSTAVGGDRKHGGICTVFVVGVAGYVKGLEEGSNIPYMHLSRFGPSGNEVRLGDGRQGSRRREGLSPHTVDAAKVRNGSELEDRILIQGICIVFVV